MSINATKSNSFSRKDLPAFRCIQLSYPCRHLLVRQNRYHLKNVRHLQNLQNCKQPELLLLFIKFVMQSPVINVLEISNVLKQKPKPDTSNSSIRDGNRCDVLPIRSQLPFSSFSCTFAIHFNNFVNTCLYMVCYGFNCHCQRETAVSTKNSQY